MKTVSEIDLCAGETLYAEGSDNDCAYVIQSGEVALFRTSATGRVYVERRGAGSIVGELSILTGKSRLVSVEAVTDCTIYRISAEQILNRFETLDPVLQACIETAINFSATINQNTETAPDNVALAQSTLRNPTELIDQFKLETELTKALGTDAFSLVFQPIVRLPDGEIIGFEALMRWHHAEMGPVPPDRFIAIAERTGGIKTLTEFAILDSCATLKRLQDTVPSAQDMFVTVNISGHDIGRCEFVDYLAFALDQHGLSAQCLKLELTETALIQNITTANDNLVRIRDLGCGLSIDDFGTGYSNLTYLKTVPMDAIKIDRAFAGEARLDVVARGIVKMLVGLGEDIGVDIIAEGVETHEDVTALSTLGCQFAQGFHFHRPMPEAALHDLIAAPTRDVA